MPDLDYRVQKAAEGVRVVQLSGFIDASTIEAFEDLLGRLEEKGYARVVFDFAEVGYVNSMGIAALLNFHDGISKRGGGACIARPDREVAITMQNLGLTELVPLYARVADAVEGREPAGTEVPAARRVRRGMPTNGSRVGAIMVAPSRNHFTDVCRMRLAPSAARIDLVHSASEAREKLAADGYGLLILEDRMPEAEQLLADVKSSVSGGLMSVLKLYPRGTDLGRYDDFKIWENDYLVEPFEVRELFVMAERELARVPAERSDMVQQTRFSFRGTGRNVARVVAVLEGLVAQSGFDEHSAIKVMSAVKEGIDNAVRHGNRHDEKRSVEVIYVLKGDRCEFVVVDEGKGFEWKPYLDRARSGDAFGLAKQAKAAGKRGGLGIKIMYECTDELRYSGRGNRLHLVKKVG